jgi:hypothetical protein
MRWRDLVVGASPSSVRLASFRVGGPASSRRCCATATKPTLQRRVCVGGDGGRSTSPVGSAAAFVGVLRAGFVPTRRKSIL